jgi:hypothetical protein
VAGFGFVRFLRFAVVLLAGGGALLAAVAPLGRRTERTLAVIATALVPVAAAGIACQGREAGVRRRTSGQREGKDDEET